MLTIKYKIHEKGKIMEKNIKKLEFDCVNRIKYEKREQFDESLFADVYSRAAGLAALIIQENVKMADEDDMTESFCTEERFNNIISFWGERGMGKSSAMLSFALFLKKYNHETEDRYHLEIKRKPGFYVLPRIDAAMLVRGEYLLDIILAKMWSAFEEKANIGLIQNGKLNETKQYFGEVKKSYEAYRKAISGQEKYEMTSVRQLKELSRCLNLKEDFKKLTEAFLSCMTAPGGEIHFLVLAIDDLDVVVGDVNNILEQIRLFLSVPKVIVLVTADYGRLFLDCNKSFSYRLVCDNINYNEKSQIRSYSEKYLAKIFPSNMRVHMPRINVTGGVDYNVKIPEESDLLDDKERFDEKRLLFIKLAKYTKIMMYPFDRRRHFLQKTSLRGIVNELYELEKMSNMKEQERFETACLWIMTALIDEGRTIMEAWEYHWAQTIFEGNSVNEAIIEILAVREEEAQRQNSQKELRTGYGQMLKLQGEGEWSGYGQMLKLLVKLMETAGRDFKRFADFVLIFYSVQAARLLWGESKGKEFGDLYGRDVFYPSVEAAAQKKGDRKENVKLDNLSSNRLQLLLSLPAETSGAGSSEEILQLFISNLTQIYNIFKLANLCEWNLWDEKDSEGSYVEFKAVEEPAEKMEDFAVENSIGEYESEDGEKQDDVPDKETNAGLQIALRVPEIDHSRVSVEMLLWNSLSYEEHLKGFCRNIYRALCMLKNKKVTEAQMEEDIKGIISRPDFHMEEYREWRKEVKDIDDLLPWQSAEVMFHLAGEIGSVQQLVGEKDEDLLTRILVVQQRQMEKIIQEMEKIEGYYQPLFTEKNAYSRILKNYLDIVKPYDIKETLIHQPEEQAIALRPVL